jgi:hypothetical protein
MNKMFWLAIATCALALSFDVSARASTVTYDVTFDVNINLPPLGTSSANVDIRFFSDGTPTETSNVFTVPINGVTTTVAGPGALGSILSLLSNFIANLDLNTLTYDANSTRVSLGALLSFKPTSTIDLSGASFATSGTDVLLNVLQLGPATIEPAGDVTFTAVGDVTSSVPEPSTWAMVILGFAGVGFIARRRSRRSPCQALITHMGDDAEVAILPL